MLTQDHFGKRQKLSVTFFFSFRLCCQASEKCIIALLCFLFFPSVPQSVEELEKEMLNGQKLQGPQTSAEVHRILKQKGMLDK